jgi:aldehyde dehydrogenase (NAD+)
MFKYVDAKSGETLSIYSPHDESLVAKNIQVAGQADVDSAVAAARAAFKGAWSKRDGAERQKVLLKFADLWEKHAAGLGEWESKCMGQPISIAKRLGGLCVSILRCQLSPNAALSRETPKQGLTKSRLRRMD